MIVLLETKGILDTRLIENLAKTLKKKLRKEEQSTLPVITCAASLANHRLLGSVGLMWLIDVDLTSVPAELLASLASCVTGIVFIKNVSGCDLVTILGSVKSKVLKIFRQSLDSEETQALVQAMESCVKEVWLDYKVTLDIRDLMEYSGQGKCRKVACYRNDRYRKQLRTWAESRNWEVTHDNKKHCFVIDRI